MTYHRFEDLPVWKEAAELYIATEELLADRSFQTVADFGINSSVQRSQFQTISRKALNAAPQNELLQFIYIARGSSGEVRSMLILKSRAAARINQNENLKTRIPALISKAESCSRQLRAWAETLQNSGIRGQRHLNEASRQLEEDKKRSEVFRNQLLRHLPPNNPLRRDMEARDRSAKSAREEI